MASLKSEPLVFSCDDPSLTNVPKKITLLVNPEALTINWKKVITRTRTKSRIVSFYWGQEPISLNYTGQTGSLIPTTSALKAASNSINRDNQLNQIAVTDVLTGLYTERDNIESTLSQGAITSPGLIAELTAQLNTVNADIKAAEESMQQLEQPTIVPGLLTTDIMLGALGDSSHTDLIKKSEKYQKFDQLRKFYEATQNVNILTKLLYRHWVFEGYFESFGFTDDAKSPWNWNYSLTFIILNWQETGSRSGNELLLVPDEA